MNFNTWNDELSDKSNRNKRLLTVKEGSDTSWPFARFKNPSQLKNHSEPDENIDDRGRRGLHGELGEGWRGGGERRKAEAERQRDQKLG